MLNTSDARLQERGEVHKRVKCVIDSAWYIRIDDYHKDLNVVSVDDEVQRFAKEHGVDYINILTLQCCNLLTMLLLYDGSTGLNNN